MRRAALQSISLTAGVVLHLALTSAAESQSRRIVDVGNAKIEVIVDDKGGSLIVLIPSTGRGCADFDMLTAGLAKEGFRILCPEPRGIGGSVGPMTNVSFHDFASDIASVIKQEGGGPAVVAGHAYGNWIARTVAMDHPNLVQGVVLIAAGAKKWPRELSEAVTTINDPTQPAATRLRALELAFFAPGNDASSWLEGWHKDVTESQRAARIRTAPESWSAGGAAPILDLQAEDDPFRPRGTANELKDELGNRVTVVVVPRASHALPVEQPAAVVRAIRAWAQRL
ncbi:alpha/beta hydrolase [Bradyrhizobium sp. CW7]|nr:alpha/beta hydrolase [Bradyrhizobium sp. CW7]